MRHSASQDVSDSEFGIPPSKNVGEDYSRHEVRGQGQQDHSDPKIVRDTSPF